MEEMSSVWSYQESIDELKQKLLYTTLELESARAQANAEISKNKEYTKQLIQLVTTVCKERDEAKDQLEKLKNKIIPFNSPEQLFTPFSQLQPDSPLIKLTKANSGITESNSLSENYNYRSHTSSPASSFFDAVTSPDLTNLNKPFVQNYHDDGSLVISKMTEGRPLPEKGNLLQAVLTAGPLLQTLMMAGPLPRWRNPPPHNPFEIPPFCISKSLDLDFVPKLFDSPTPFIEKNNVSSQLMPRSSIVNFGSGAYGSCLSTSGSLIVAGSNISNYGFSGKRQRSL